MNNHASEVSSEYLLSYLGKNKLMSMATVSQANKPWNATVFFAYDELLNLYFYSDPATQHAENIENNPAVSITINQDWGKSGFVKGLQYQGAAQLAQDKLSVFHQRYTWALDYQQTHRLYQVSPSEIWLIDSRLFGHHFRVQVYPG